MPANENEEFEFRLRAEQEAQAAPAKQAAPAEQPKQSLLERFKASMPDIRQGAGNVMAGAVRGAGSIGATILYPWDKGQDLYYGDRDANLANLITGKQPLSRNEERRAAIDEGLQSMGAEPDSLLYKGGKLAGEIAGTAGAGGVLANGVRAVSAAPRAIALANAIQTGGMTAGSTPGAANMLTRMAGGAITGGASSAMIDPKNAGTGAIIGGALPPVLAGAGKVGSVIGNTIRGPEVAPEARQAIEAARNIGYVIPPTQAKPTLANRLMEGFSGKITTAQNASAKNQPVTNSIVAKELGLPQADPITVDALKAVRQQAGKAYDAVGSTGTINTTPAYDAALDNITASAKKASAGFPNAKPNPLIAEIESLKTSQLDASSAVAKIKELRNSADSAYRSGDKDLGKALKDGAGAIEDAIEEHLKTIGASSDILSGFRDARQLIAKTYSVEKAMNTTTGNIDAGKLAAQLTKGKPLSGGIRDAAEFGQRFPKAVQSIDKMGSLPQISPLDFGTAAISGSAMGPIGLAGLVARPAVRALTLSPMVQNRLAAQPSNNALINLLSDPRSEQMLYRSVPALSNH